MDPSEILKVPIIDDHCHAFLPEKETKEFEQYLSLSLLDLPINDVRNLFLYRRIVNELARVLKCKPSEAIKKRRELYKENPRKYIETIFQDANITVLLVDTGYPCEEYSGYSVSLETFKELVPCQLKPIYRIDNAITRFLYHDISFQHFLDKYIKAVKHAVKEEGAIAAKSVAAYTTGLEFSKVPDDDAEKAFESIRSRISLGEKLTDQFLASVKEAKTLMDYLIFKTATICGELDVPIQIHVGIGDSPVLDLRKANPILLYDLINDEDAKKTKIIFVHTGYPYVEEAGYLANQYPNVYLDLSEMTPFISYGIKDKLLRLLEMCPTNKILYGSDGYHIPELFWIAALETRKSLIEVTEHFIDKKLVEEEWISNVSKQILFENSKRVYNLNL